ncbi:ca2+-binding protein 1 [Wolffia australiana]
MCPRGSSYGEEREEQLRPAFEALDVDGDGRIGREDLKSVFGIDRPDALIDSMIDSADVDRDGYVAFQDFSKIILRQRRRGSSHGILTEAFEAMDRDGDGLLGFDDLKSLMGLLGCPGLAVSDDDIRAMIGLAGGGPVSFQNFLKVLPPG